MLIYTFSTPLSSEAVNLSIDPGPHEFSTGKSENINSASRCAGVGQRRAAAWQRQEREAASQNASLLSF